MRINVVLSLLKKEFLNIIRDKKSFIIMILLPLLMFPVMIGLISFMLTSFTKIDSKITFGVNYELTDDFQNFVDNYDTKYKFNIVNGTEKELKEKFDDGDLNLYVIKNGDTYELHFDENSTTNVSTSSLIENIYEDYQEKYISDYLNTEGINYDEVKAQFNIKVVQESITEMGSLIPSIISMALIMIISSVCFSVAIDITTSEKEKGTLETILSLPIKKSELITSKFLTVFILSSLSGILAYISLFGTLFFARNTLELLGVTAITIDIKLLLLYLIAIILISLLFSGLLLSVTIFSKNLKEAQNSLYPMELFVTFISMLPMLGINASMKLALIPFVNISLLFNNALSTNIDAGFVVITLLSTLCYSSLLILLLSKIYNQEDVLFNTKSMNYLVFDKGKPKTICFSPLTAIIIAILIILLTLYFSIMFVTSSTYILIAITPLTMIGVVLIASLINHLDFKKGFKFNKFSIRKFMLLLAMYVGTYIISSRIVDLVCKIFPSIVTDYSKYADILNVDNIFLGVIVIALIPAIAEELLFRGVIYNSFAKKWGVTFAIIASALIFGIYHMNWVQGINAFIMGIFLAYVCYKTNSIIPSMIIHFLNNSFAVIMEFASEYVITIPGIVQGGMLILAVVIVCSIFYVLEKEIK